MLKQMNYSMEKETIYNDRFSCKKDSVKRLRLCKDDYRWCVVISYDDSYFKYPFTNYQVALDSYNSILNKLNTPSPIIFMDFDEIVNIHKKTFNLKIEEQENDDTNYYKPINDK